MSHIEFTAPPTCAAFMKSDAFFRLLAGPVGSGKTTAAIFELLRRSMEQSPGADGLRHTRWAIVRQTLKQLKDTVLKDILQWLPTIATYKVSDNIVYIHFGDVRSEWLLIPLDDPEDQKRLLSMQLTGAWLSEAIEMPSSIVQPVLGRCGRYPSANRGTPTWFGAIADTNFPTEGDNWYKLMEEDTPSDWQVFKQPGGLSPGAENLNWLTQTADSIVLPLDHPFRLAAGRRYYERLAEGNKHSPDWVKRYVHAQYGNDPSGSAVHRETFKRGFHTIKLSNEDRQEGRETALIVGAGYPLIVAQDFGRNPCSLICQADHKGRGLVLEEVVSEDMGLEKHIIERLKPVLMKERYALRPCYVVGDPSGAAKSSHYEENSFDILKKHGFRAYAAPTNDLDRRLQAVDGMLLQQRDGGAALLIDEDLCPMLVLSLQGRYRYAKRRTGELSPRPEKTHPWSDLADDLQYFCLVLQGGMHDYISERLRLAPVVSLAAPRQRISPRAWT